MDFYKRALELNDETIAHRRFFHKNAETGLNMPVAVDYVMKKLTEYGLKAQKCGYGVTAILGKGEKTLPKNQFIEYFYCKKTPAKIV